jgi:LmbE family N-acetylglucosaminyl deacetylase
MASSLMRTSWNTASSRHPGPPRACAYPHAGGRARGGLLAVAPAERFFLGYPDGGIADLLHDPTTICLPLACIPAPPPYRTPRPIGPGAAYTGTNLERDLRAVIERLQPTWVLAPTPLDAARGSSRNRRARHPHHGVARAIRARALLDRARRHRLAVAARPASEDALVPPRRARALPWQDFALTSAERDAKAERHRLCMKRSCLLTSSFMLSFVKRNEIYSAAPLLPALVAARIAVKTAAAEDPTAASLPHALK